MARPSSSKKSTGPQLSFVVGALSGIALLIFGGVFVSGGGVERVAHTLFGEGGSQLACIFHCNHTSYELEALFPEDTSGNVKETFRPGETINWQWNAGSYGANNFLGVCQGSSFGSGWACSVQQGSPRTDFGSCGGVQYICTHSTTPPFSCDKLGNCSGGTPVCDAYETTYGSKADCGNADMRYGTTCFSNAGGTTPSCPGYWGNWPPSTTQTTAPSTPGTYTYYFFSSWLTWNKGMGPIATTITVANPSCSNGLDSNSYPSCTCPSGQTQSGSACVANPPTSCSNGLNTTYLPSCTCPSGQTQSGSACVTAPTSCTNGLNPTSYPTCTCPSGQTQSGSTCVAQAGCSNGLGSGYLPSCTCPSGQTQSGSVCVAIPTSCSNGLNTSYLPSCTCPSGQVQNGATCVAPGAINSLTANPTRVRKGNTTAVTWSTSNMATCALTGPNATTGTIATLSTALSTTLNATVISQSTYTLTCVDKIGTTRSQSTTVNLVPDVQEQ